MPLQSQKCKLSESNYLLCICDKSVMLQVNEKTWTKSEHFGTKVTSKAFFTSHAAFLHQLRPAPPDHIISAH